MMGGVENYEVYVLTGILFWNLTATSLIGSTHSLIANAGLLRKVRVPYFIFVLVAFLVWFTWYSYTAHPADYGGYMYRGKPWKGVGR